MDNASFPPAPLSNAEFVTIWAYLKDGLDCMMLNFEQGVSYEYYMSLYTTVYNWHTLAAVNGVTVQLPETSDKALIEEKLIAYFGSVSSSLNQPSNDDPVLNMYAALWDRFKNGVNYVNRLFSYHNRHWVRKQRTLKENPRPTLMVVEIAYVQWRENVFLPRKEDIVAALLEAIDRLRSGEEGDEVLVKTVVDSIAALDIDPNGGKSLLFFETTLEVRLLTSTTAYYAGKKEGASPAEVEKWMREEKERAERLLPKETAEKILEAARQALA